MKASYDQRNVKYREFEHIVLKPSIKYLNTETGWTPLSNWYEMYAMLNKNRSLEHKEPDLHVSVQTSDGGTVCWLGFLSRALKQDEKRPTLVFCTTVTGTWTDYADLILYVTRELEWNMVVLQRRGAHCMIAPEANAKIFPFGNDEDTWLLLQSIRKHFLKSALVSMGVSAGAMEITRYLATRTKEQRNQVNILASVGICAPYNADPQKRLYSVFQPILKKRIFNRYYGTVSTHKNIQSLSALASSPSVSVPSFLYACANAFSKGASASSSVKRPALVRQTTARRHLPISVLDLYSTMDICGGLASCAGFTDLAPIAKRRSPEDTFDSSQSLLDKLHHIQCPTLLINAENDPLQVWHDSYLASIATNPLIFNIITSVGSHYCYHTIGLEHVKDSSLNWADIISLEFLIWMIREKTFTDPLPTLFRSLRHKVK